MDVREVHLDLAEMGLAPEWAKGAPPIPEPVPNLPFSDALETWFKFTPAPGSLEEKNLLQRLDTTVQNRQVLAKGLQTNATPDDLRNLFHACAKNSVLVRRAILRHAATDAVLIREVASVANRYEQHFVVINEHTPPDVLERTLQIEHPDLRRLVRRQKNAPPTTNELSRRVFVDYAGRAGARLPPFASFVAALYGAGNLNDLPKKAEHWVWTERLEAVFLAAPNDDPIPRDPEKRTGSDLLNHLSCDGNHIVRAAAQARLADPAYRFSLWSPSEEATPPT